MPYTTRTVNSFIRKISKPRNAITSLFGRLTSISGDGYGPQLVDWLYARRRCSNVDLTSTGDFPTRTKQDAYMPRREAELRVRCAAMNRVTSLEMPRSYAA